jgi:NAD-dependent SIR2 family protein deacetylase
MSNLERLTELTAGGDVLILTGAGVSTDSGIPAYRDERGDWQHAKPVQYRDFVGSDAVRRRYWARSSVGWTRLRETRPNAAHHAFAALEQRGLTSLLVTQNVDRLHQAAGSRDVVDLHGRIDRVICLGCRRVLPRAAHQHALTELNPHWLSPAATTTPDGDADLGVADYAAFRVVACDRCGGILKPDVVFFGENVPPDRVERAMSALERARALLIAGSSLMVFSGYRFARAASRRNIPIAVINRGRTRADELATLKVEENIGDVLTRVVAAL